jgi:hypothetical protein
MVSVNRFIEPNSSAWSMSRFRTVYCNGASSVGSSIICKFPGEEVKRAALAGCRFSEPRRVSGRAFRIFVSRDA